MGFPSDTSDCFTAQDVPGVHLDLVANPEDTCEALPGKFLLDFGNFTPPGCQCEFHVYIDQNSNATLTQNNRFFFPAEAAFAIPALRNALAMWELMPGVGTPLHPLLSPTFYDPPPDDIDEAFS